MAKRKNTRKSTSAFPPLKLVPKPERSVSIARSWFELGILTVPVKHKSKKPRGGKDWQKLRVTNETIPQFFKSGDNVGGLWGEPSDWIVDIDLDWDETVELAPYFLPETFSYGRKSRPNSHYLFRCHGITTAKKHLRRDSKILDPDDKNDKGMIVEIRSTGSQSVLPPSFHDEDHERYEINHDVDFTEIGRNDLETRVNELAAAALFVRCYPGHGSQHDYIHTVTGSLLWSGQPPEKVRKFMKILLTVIGDFDKEKVDRNRSVENTIEHFEKDDKIKGWPSLSEWIDGTEIQLLKKWLTKKAVIDEENYSDLESLDTKLLPVEEFDLSMLPDPFKSWIADIAYRMDDAPVDYAAATLMVALGNLLGSTTVIRPKKHDNWEVVPNLWGAIVGRPATKKTPLMNEVLAPLRSMEAEASKDYCTAMDQHPVLLKLNKLQQKEAENQASKKIRSGNHADAEALLIDADQDEPQVPPRVRYITNDATTEKSGEILHDNPEGILQYRDELSGWLAGLRCDNRAQDRAFYLEAWNGNTRFTYDRISRGTIEIENLTIGVFGGIQPGKLQPLLAAQNEGLGDDGLMERLQMLVYPDLSPVKPVDQVPDAKACKEAYEVFESFQEIRKNGVQKPFHFDDQAQDLFDSWYYKLITKARAETNPHLESHLAKYASLMPSIALITHIAEGDPETPVSYDAAHKATQWCDYLESHARRIYGLEDDPKYGARMLAKRLGSLPNPFQTKDFIHNGWSGLTNAAEINRALTVLCEHGYLIAKTEETRTKPKTLYHINPKVLEKG